LRYISEKLKFEAGIHGDDNSKIDEIPVMKEEQRLKITIYKMEISL
jgi:hypothetical protein